MLFRPFQLESERELERHPQLTWTLIRNGLFLDYLGMPSRPKPSNLMSWSIFVDLAHRKCVFPGDGTQTMIFTHSTDLAAYVERLIGLPAKDWPRESLIQPNRIMLRELAQIVQDITGTSRLHSDVDTYVLIPTTGQSFGVTYDSATAIHQGHITPLPANEELFSHPSWGALYRLVEKEAMFTLLSNGYELAGTDLGDIFPDVPTTNLGDFLRQSWEMLQST